MAKDLQNAISDSVKNEKFLKYRVVQDEDTGEWLVNTCYLDTLNGKLLEAREIDVSNETFYVQSLLFDTIEEAEEFCQECRMDTRYDVLHMPDDEAEQIIYNYIVNNNLEGFVFIKPLEVWIHTDFIKGDGLLVYGDMSFVASELAHIRGKDEAGMCYPFRTDAETDHAHSFEEILQLCAVNSSFEPLETDKFYSKQELELIKLVMAENHK